MCSDPARTALTDQTFGVDIEARARADRKRVPVIVTTILTYLDDRKEARSSCSTILPDRRS